MPTLIKHVLIPQGLEARQQDQDDQEGGASKDRGAVFSQVKHGTKSAIFFSKKLR